MSELPQEAPDPIAADAAAKHIAAIRAWQKERLEDMVSGQGGFVHLRPSEKAQPAAIPAAHEPPGGLAGGVRQAAEIISATLSTEPHNETIQPPPETPPDQPVGELIPADSNLDEEVPARTGAGSYTAAELRDQEEDYAPPISAQVTEREKREAARILVYETIWLAGLIAAHLTLPMLRILPEAAQLIAAGLFGAVGGTVGAVAALRKQSSLSKEREIRHQVWYFSQPVIGFPLGMFVFLLLQTTVVYSAGTGSAVVHPAIINVACAYAGFRQDALTGFRNLIRSRPERQ